MGNYLTVTELRQSKVNGQVVDLSSYTDDELEIQIGIAEGLIEQITGRKFYLYEETYYFDGSGNNRLFFAPIVGAKLNQLLSVSEINDNSETVYDYDDVKDFTPHLGYSLETRDGLYGDSIRDKLFGGRGIWPEGQSNIKLRGIWGEETPAAIKYVTGSLALEGLQSGLSGLVSYNAQSVEWPDYKITFRSKGSDSSSGGSSPTGFEKLDTILAQYTNSVIPFFRV